jgi:tRNA G37 N-methylase Trm5
LYTISILGDILILKLHESTEAQDRAQLISYRPYIKTVWRGRSDAARLLHRNSPDPRSFFMSREWRNPRAWALL